MTGIHAAYLGDVLRDVSNEGVRAHSKFGEQTGLTDLEWLAILAEEFGEAAMAVVKRDIAPLTADAPMQSELRAEVVQVAAVAARWVAAMDARR